MILDRAWRTARARVMDFLARARQPDFWRRRAALWTKTILGFAIAASVLCVAALFLVEAASRVRLQAPERLSTPPHGTQTLAAASYLFALEAGPALDSDRVFAPSALERRETAAYDGAAAPARAFMATLDVRRGGGDALLAEARASAAGADEAGAAGALARLNAAVARRQIVLAGEGERFAAIAQIAALACAARAADLSQRVASSAEAPMADETAFERARGEAFGWAMMLRAAAADAGVGQNRALDRALTALDAAAAYNPILFPDGPRGAFGASHLAVVGLHLAVAADAARGLQSP